jgi:phage/plasmid-associated DNA primase
MDVLASFLEDRCVLDEKAVAPATLLYREYQAWCEKTGETTETQRQLGMRLRERGFVSVTLTSGPHKARKGWTGIGFRTDLPDPDDDGQPGRPSVDKGNSTKIPTLQEKHAGLRRN